ncbi:MAG TPA: hypothetical protein VMU83_13090 [Hanamia sp.]|nr:hypothetical protein [Hanamia sp.]
MKTTFLLSIGFLFSTVSFGQTTVKNSEAIKTNSAVSANKSSTQANTQVSASSETHIQSNAVANTKKESNRQVKNEKHAMLAQKDKLAAEARTKDRESEKVASKDAAVTTSEKATATANVNAKDNKINNHAYVNTGAKVSSDATKTTGQIKNEEVANIKTQDHTAIKNSKHVKAEVNKTAIKTGKALHENSSATVHVRAASTNRIHVKPATIQMRSIATTTNGIRLK